VTIPALIVIFIQESFRTGIVRKQYGDKHLNNKVDFKKSTLLFRIERNDLLKAVFFFADSLIDRYYCQSFILGNVLGC